MDAIDRAIKATVEPLPVRMMRIPVTIASTGRPAFLELPADVNDAELLEFIGWLAGIAAVQLRAQRVQPRSRLVVPS